jgi:uncharacterized membrane protein YheB (UPF0754 family)
VEGLSREESVVRLRNKRLTREEIERRLKEMGNELLEERLRRIEAEDKLKMRKGLEDKSQGDIERATGGKIDED